MYDFEVIDMWTKELENPMIGCLVALESISINR